MIAVIIIRFSEVPEITTEALWARGLSREPPKVRPKYFQSYYLYVGSTLGVLWEYFGSTLFNWEYSGPPLIMLGRS